MFATTIYLDKPIPLDRLAGAFASATDVSLDRVAAITRADFERSPRRWFIDGQAIGLQVWEERGDFPFAVEFLAREDVAFPTVIGQVTRELGVTALTDVFGVDPMSDTVWTMVTPDGTRTTVFTDNVDAGDEEPDLVLHPLSRLIYEARRQPPTVVTI